MMNEAWADPCKFILIRHSWNVRVVKLTIQCTVPNTIDYNLWIIYNQCYNVCSDEMLDFGKLGIHFFLTLNAIFIVNNNIIKYC